VARKLINAMENNILLQGEGRRLVPNVYDIYISTEDHKRLSPGESILKKDWQDHLIEIARQRHYTLLSLPVLRLHADTKLHLGTVRVEAELLDRQHLGGDPNVEGGIMATKALSAQEVAQLRAQMQPPPDASFAGASSPNQPGAITGMNIANYPPSASVPPVGLSQTSGALLMPYARLMIRQPQGGQREYRLDKAVVNIGRQLTNDIIIEDKRVSRYHAQIKYQANGDFTIFDLGSTNGITVNGTPNLRLHTLQNGDRFTIGSYDFYFERR
jgi:hypothetical protein